MASSHTSSNEHAWLTGMGPVQVGNSSMQTVRSGPAVTASADGHSILVAGGFAEGKALDSVEVFDVRADSWRTDAAPMNMTRSYACAAVLDGAWHVVGGNSEVVGPPAWGSLAGMGVAASSGVGSEP